MGPFLSFCIICSFGPKKKKVGSLSAILRLPSPGTIWLQCRISSVVAENYFRGKFIACYLRENLQLDVNAFIWPSGGTNVSPLWPPKHISTKWTWSNITNCMTRSDSFSVSCLFSVRIPFCGNHLLRPLSSFGGFSALSFSMEIPF